METGREEANSAGEGGGADQNVSCFRISVLTYFFVSGYKVLRNFTTSNTPGSAATTTYYSVPTCLM